MLWEKHELEERWQRRRLAMTMIAARLGRRTIPSLRERLVTLGPVLGAVQVFTSGACFCIRLEMDPTDCLKKLEDFFCPSGVPTSNYGLVMRYLLSGPVRCVLYLVGQARENSFEELKRELLNKYGPEKSSVELIERIHALRQRESQIIKQCAEEELGRRAGVSERDLVALFAGGVASREVHRAIRLQESPMPRRITQTCQKSEQGGEALSGATTTAHWRYETREG
ncbi:hypothetical protein Tsp_11301 [Trichinella spiralis]|uniref:Uncharacterized protein n=1 Tax=Trichinella spiralis TaxID=6334 RepID=E5SYI2_TRISP|nr:hypothetical protein Tsp_11301 [Trichinella spiralis]KRY27273.1 hypothetical protein T01_598 [Trichinella spiralis]